MIRRFSFFFLQFFNFFLFKTIIETWQTSKLFWMTSSKAQLLYIYKKNKKNKSCLTFKETHKSSSHPMESNQALFGKQCAAEGLWSSYVCFRAVMSFTCLSRFLNVCLNICMQMHHVSYHLLFPDFSSESIYTMVSIFPYNSAAGPYCFPWVAIQLHNDKLHMPTITNYILGCTAD